MSPYILHGSKLFNIKYLYTGSNRISNLKKKKKNSKDESSVNTNIKKLYFCHLYSQTQLFPCHRFSNLPGETLPSIKWTLISTMTV